MLKFALTILALVYLVICPIQPQCLDTGGCSEQPCCESGISSGQCQAAIKQADEIKLESPCLALLFSVETNELLAPTHFSHIVQFLPVHLASFIKSHPPTGPPLIG